MATFDLWMSFPQKQYAVGLLFEAQNPVFCWEHSSESSRFDIREAMGDGPVINSLQFPFRTDGLTCHFSTTKKKKSAPDTDEIDLELF